MTKQEVAEKITEVLLEREGREGDVRALLTLAHRLELYDIVIELLKLREFFRRR